MNIPNRKNEDETAAFRAFLRNKRILVLEALSGGAALIGEAVLAGARVTVVTSALPDCEMSPAMKALNLEVIVADTTNAASVLSAVTSPGEYQFDAVFPGCDAFVVVASRVADGLGLTGQDTRTSERLQNKFAMRSALETAGVRAPKFSVVINHEELEAAAQRIGFPAVIKPLHGSGSWHVRKVNTVQDLIEGLESIQSDESLDMGFSAGSSALVEQYVDGPEFSVEGFVSQGRATVVAITQKKLGNEPYFVETGHVVPARVSEGETAVITAYVIEVISAVNLSWGAFHAELRLSSDGPVLMEIGARLSGDKIWDLVQRAVGVNLPRAWICTAFGLEPREFGCFGNPSAKIAAIDFVSPPTGGRLTQIDGAEAARKIAGVAEVVIWAKPGYELRAEQDFSNRIGHVLSEADTREQLEQIFAEVTSTIHFETEPLP